MNPPQSEPFYDPVTSRVTYLLFDRATRDAIAIDPGLDFQPSSGQVSLESAHQLAARLRGLGLTLHFGLETSE